MSTPDTPPPNEPTPTPRYARWEDVPAEIRERIEAQLKLYELAFAPNPVKGTDDPGVLRLNFVRMDDAVLEVFLREKRTLLANVTELRLNGTRIRDAGMAHLATALSAFKSLRSLDISQNTIGEAGMASLSPALAKSKSLRSLDLSGSPLTNAGILHLAPALAHLTELQTLCLRDNQIGDVGIAYLAESLIHLTDLRALDLAHNEFGNEVMMHLAYALTHLTQLRSLDLSVNSIGRDGMPRLARSLHKLAVLQTLNLSGCPIADEGMEHLAPALPDCKALETLVLGSNQIGFKGMAFLANALTKLNTLKALYLGENELTDEGIAYLAETLPALKSLQALYLRSNQLTDEGIVHLAKPLAELKSLLALDISRNRIGDKGIADLANVLAGLKALRKLNLGDNRITDTVALITLINTMKPGGSVSGALAEISIGDNPLKRPDGVPIEMSGLSIGTQPVDEVLTLLRARLAVDAYLLREARVVFVGVGENGKTQLSGALAGQLGRGDEAEKFTKGVNVFPYAVVGTDGKPIGVKLFDMGGQPGQYSLHYLLLEQHRNVFILVCDGTKHWGWEGDCNRGRYFLDMIRAGGTRPTKEGDAAPRAPVLGVVTKADKMQEKNLHLTTPDILRQAATNAGMEINVIDPAIDALRQTGLDRVKSSMDDAIRTMPATAVGEHFPKVRAEVLNTFGDYKADGTGVINAGMAWYVEEAQKAGESDPVLMEDHLRLMHALGDLFYFDQEETDDEARKADPQDEQADPRDEQTDDRQDPAPNRLNGMIVNAHWARRWMYALLTIAHNRHAGGLLTDAEWERIAIDANPHVKDKTSSEARRGLETLQQLMIRQKLMYEQVRHDPVTNRKERKWVVPDLLAYAPADTRPARKDWVCAVVFDQFLWESTFLRFVGAKRKFIDWTMKTTYRDQATLNKHTGECVVVRADYETYPMSIQFHARDPEHTPSRHWARRLGEELQETLCQDHGRLGPRLITPRTTRRILNPAERKMALAHLQVGIGGYSREQTLRARLVAWSIGFFVLGVALLPLSDDWTWLKLVVATLGSIVPVAQLVLHDIPLSGVRRQAARAFEHLDDILFGDLTRDVDEEDKKLINANLLTRLRISVEDWYVDINTIELVSTQKLTACLQEATFRKTEHFRALAWVVGIGVGLFLIFAIVYAVTESLSAQMKYGWLPLAPLASMAIQHAWRNIAGYLAARDLATICQTHRGQFDNHAEDTLGERMRIGTDLLAKLAAFRAQHPPVSDFVYKRCREDNNTRARQATRPSPQTSRR